MPDISTTFAQLLISELQVTQSLHQLLEQELAAFRNRELKPLADLQQQKSQLLSTLQSQSRQRLDWMTQEQLPHSRDCLLRPEFADQNEIKTLWQQLADSYSANQQLSEVLSEMVLKARKRTIDQLNILRGKQNDPQLYSATGKARGLNRGSGYTTA